MSPDPVAPAIFEAKLQPPAKRPSEVARRQLLARLAESPEASVVTVIAPAGYGKTTLLRQAVEADARASAWLSLDPRDDDPVVMVAHLVAAIGRSAPVPASLVPALRSPGASVWTFLMPRFGAAMAEWAPSLLVVDDVQEIHSRDALDVLAWIALNVPRGSRLVFGGREPAGLPIARLRLESRLLELGPLDLRLSDDEAAQLLANERVDVDVARAAELNRRCEGWAGGLQLALLAASAEGERLSHAQVAGRDHLLTEYVRTEILSRFDAATARFLLRTSVLYELHSGLCDAVLEGTGSGATLLRLERSNALITALDREHGSYRYHDLFREALLAELERSEPDLPAALRRRAAEWHIASGRIETGIRYAQESGDDELAGRLMGRSAQPVMNQGRHATVVGWLEWAEGRRLADRDPSLAMSGAMAFAILGDAERSARWAAALERAERTGPMLDGSPSVDASRAVIRASQGRGTNEEVVEAALAACDSIPATSPWRTLALTALGTARLMAGHAEEARAVLEEAVDPTRTPYPQPNACSIALGLLARQALLDSDPTLAHRRLAEADELRRENGLTEQSLQAFIDAMAARLALAEGARSETVARLAHAQRLRTQLTWALPSLAVLTRLELARVYLAMADPAAARTLVLEIGDILRHRPGLGAFAQESDDLRRQLAEIRSGVVGASTLTAAELRLLPMLATHLTLHQIGERLFLSTNTIKTQATSIYRKLDATSRTEAVERAAGAGLLDPAAVTSILTRGDGRRGVTPIG